MCILKIFIIFVYFTSDNKCNTFTFVFLKLDYKVTWWKLKDVFKLAGNVIKAEIKEDKAGKSRGMGVVVFEHPMEAVQAVCILYAALIKGNSIN